MQAYRTHLVIENPERVTVSNLPFRPGQYVEVLFIAQDTNRALAVQELQALLKETQALPQVQALTEDEIAAEVVAHRRGQ
jgi:hypothetical protein